MATLGKDFQPMIKDASSVLVGVAQIRVGKPSIRSAGTGVVKAVQFVGTSLKLTDTSTGASIDYVKPDDMSTGGVLPAGCTLVSAGTYNTTKGLYDGCFIIRAASPTTVDIFAPNGYKDAGITISTFAATPKDMKLNGTDTSGVTIQGVPATTITTGMTWVVPVWSGAAQDKVQTGVVSPYSPFSGSAESVGGLKDAKFAPKLDSVKTLEAGFPAVKFDSIIEKTSIDIDFTAYEFTNTNMTYLQKMLSQVVNDAQLPAISIEVVARTRGNDLITFWVPNSSIVSLPEINPQNDFSTLAWKLTASKQTEITGETDTYNVWLKNANIYTQLEYVH